MSADQSTVPVETVPPSAWDDMTPEKYELARPTSGWTWCAPGELPSSYEWEAPCTPVDPCVNNNITLWRLTSCASPAVVVDADAPTTDLPTFASTSQPMTLPSTGTAEIVGTGALAITLISIGVLFRHLAKR
jgi:hypothetical protein